MTSVVGDRVDSIKDNFLGLSNSSMLNPRLNLPNPFNSFFIGIAVNKPKNVTSIISKIINFLQDKIMPSPCKKNCNETANLSGDSLMTSLASSTSNNGQFTNACLLSFLVSYNAL